MARFVAWGKGRWAAAALAALLAATPSLPTAATGAADVSASALPSYELGPGDKIHITVYGEEGLTGDYLVSSRGMVSVPLIGDFPAAGQTISDFRIALQNRLAKGILNDPRVAAEIVEYRPFFILGEVNKPGQYPYSIGLTVYSAVATAQGFTYRANTHKVMITHAGETEEHRVRVSAATRIMPGDTVRVLERFF
jgi:polysaccharide export outer membrane protein